MLIIGYETRGNRGTKPGDRRDVFWYLEAWQKRDVS